MPSDIMGIFLACRSWGRNGNRQHYSGGAKLSHVMCCLTVHERLLQLAFFAPLVCCGFTSISEVGFPYTWRSVFAVQLNLGSADHTAHVPLGAVFRSTPRRTHVALKLTRRRIFCVFTSYPCRIDVVAPWAKL